MTKTALLLLLLTACGLPTSPPREPFQVAAGGMRRFPFAFDVDGGGVIVSHSTHKDDYLQAGTAETQRLGRPATQAPDFFLSGVVKLADGRLYGASYATYAAGPGYDQIHGWVSDNGGASWSPRNGTLQLQEPRFERPAGWGALLMHRRMYRVGGALVATAYGGYARDAMAGGGQWYRSVWIKSLDEGLSWTVSSTIAEGPAGTEGYGEPVSAFCPDGRLLVVMRTGPTTPMRWARSSDGGATWSAPHELPGMAGWDPDLLAVPGGLVLSWGVTGEFHLAASPDCGDSWSRFQDFDIDTTSGYTGLAQNGGLTVFADRAGETEIWGYPVKGLPL